MKNKGVSIRKHWILNRSDRSIEGEKPSEYDANTSFIARALNSHVELVQAATEALEYIERHTKGIVIDCKDALRLALQKAEAKQNAKVKP